MRLERIIAAIGFGIAATALVAMPKTASAISCGVGCDFTVTLFTGTEPPAGFPDLDVVHAAGFITAGPVVTQGMTITGVGGVSTGLGAAAPSGEYVGSVTNVAVTPFTGASPPGTATNADDAYFAAQPGGQVNVSSVNAFSASNPLALLWGSVDTETGRNVLTSTGFTINGADVFNNCAGAILHVSTCLVTISTATPFSSFIASDAAGSTSAFEFLPRGVPEPASLALFGTALAGLGLLRRRRKSA